MHNIIALHNPFHPPTHPPTPFFSSLLLSQAWAQPLTVERHDGMEEEEEEWRKEERGSLQTGRERGVGYGEREREEMTGWTHAEALPCLFNPDEAD